MTSIPRSDRGVNRRTVLKLAGAVGGLTAGLGGVGSASGQPSGSIPSQAAYNVQLAGATAYGGFARTATLAVLPPLDVSGVNFDNGQNPRDVALVSGNPPAAPEQGAIWFATNNGVYDLLGLQTTTGDALADVAVVTADPGAGLVRIDLDPNAARTVHLNTMNARGGLLANVYQLLEGRIDLRFANGGRTVAGTVDLVGNGFIEPGPSPYRATLEGTLASA